MTGGAGEGPAGIPAEGSLTSHYEYFLPPDRIARYPADRRDDSRLLVVPRDPDLPLGHMRFRDVADLFRPGDVLVVNESRVLPARLLGRKPTGAPAEILLIRPWRGPAPSANFPAGGGTPAHQPSPTLPHHELWEALVRPGGKLKPGRTVELAEDFRAEILDSTPDGGRVVRLLSREPVEDAIARHGQMPLPPYIDRDAEPLDRDRYQTVYARVKGSVAAPTAGLHFTPELLDELAIRGVHLARVTLHVGIGTFRPVEEDDPGSHPMHAEFYHVSPEAAETINRSRVEGGRVWAVGTTVVRTLETVVGDDGRVRPGHGSTRLFIRPPFRFRSVDALITNFHLPRSTLMMLVAAFAGFRRTLEAYEAAVAEGYRFYSYGDAMVIL